jgi:hypothetical protein
MKEDIRYQNWICDRCGYKVQVDQFPDGTLKNSDDKKKDLNEFELKARTGDTYRSSYRGYCDNCAPVVYERIKYILSEKVEANNEQ